MAVDGDGSILVADASNTCKCVRKFTPDGKFVASNTNNAQLVYPVGIKIHPDSKQIYVSDMFTKHIYISNPDSGHSMIKERVHAYKFILCRALIYM